MSRGGLVGDAGRDAAGDAGAATASPLLCRRLCAGAGCTAGKAASWQFAVVACPAGFPSTGRCPSCPWLIPSPCRSAARLGRRRHVRPACKALLDPRLGVNCAADGARGGLEGQSARCFDEGVLFLPDRLRGTSCSSQMTARRMCFVRDGREAQEWAWCNFLPTGKPA